VLVDPVIFCFFSFWGKEKKTTQRNDRLKQNNYTKKQKKTPFGHGYRLLSDRFGHNRRMPSWPISSCWLLHF
jgi:hypothetical protein